MDRFAIESDRRKGTTVTIKKLLPPGSPFLPARDLGRLSEELAREGLQNPLAEVQQQNQELLHVLDDLRRRQEDLVRVNRELEDTNRGVVALYAELDEKAEHLRRADEMKSRFLSNMSHEFRTPLNSILAISKLLQDRTDGELTAEQEKQVGFVRKAAQDLAELVNDLLDLAKVEAGKTVVRPVEFEIENLFGALRGMLRPLLVTETVRLVFEDGELPPVYSDEAKVSQILRNFISNALKFTERGEIRVRRGPGGGRGHGRLLRRGHRHRHRPRGSGADLQRVRPGRKPASEAVQGHGAGPGPLAEAGGAAGGAHHRGERGRTGVHVPAHRASLLRRHGARRTSRSRHHRRAGSLTGARAGRGRQHGEPAHL